ncbi:DMT family transporter [Roseovarius sp. 2305UL8-3]|uniref:DMT family transporter n=1 Tax=Roseovarius conchicola TaxID=3121636 RepID=UPI00352798C3
MSYFLLAIAVLSWGVSWFAITLQVAHAPAMVSIAYRFALASLVLVAYLALTGRLKPIPLRDHGALAGLGACLFSLNFYCYYLAADSLTSGLMSVIFATAAIIGALNQKLFWGVPLDRRVMAAAAIGVVGLMLLIGPEVRMDVTALGAVGLCVLGTYFFSLGNLISSRLGQRHALPNMAGQGMVYGALIAIVVSWLTGEAFVLPKAPEFWGSLLFLALISTVVAFLAYLNLIRREGPVRASYATVLFPIIAMAVSSLWEGYVWSVSSGIGLALTLVGTVIVFSRRAG